MNKWVCFLAHLYGVSLAWLCLLLLSCAAAIYVLFPLLNFHDNGIELELTKVTRSDWPKSNYPKPYLNWHVKELNWFRLEIQNWTDPKLNQPETIMARIDQKSAVIRIEFKLTRAHIDLMQTQTRNDPIRIKPKSIYTRTDPTQIGKTTKITLSATDHKNSFIFLSRIDNLNSLSHHDSCANN